MNVIKFDVRKFSDKACFFTRWPPEKYLEGSEYQIGPTVEVKETTDSIGSLRFGVVRSSPNATATGVGAHPYVSSSSVTSSLTWCRSVNACAV